MAAVAPPSTRLEPPTQDSRVGQAVLLATLGLGYISVSSGLIAYNKFLIHWGRFPYAVPLVFMHSVFCSVLAFITYLIKPSLFPSLSDPARRVPLDRDLILKGSLPIACFFSAQLALSNSAYLHSSVAFLQMMKEANLAVVYTMSLAFALERFSSRNAFLLVAVIGATLLTIHGEINFSPTGFALQGASQLFECTKIVLQAMLLSAAGRKLDALTYVLLVMPFCAILLGSSICGIYLWSPQSTALPSFAVIREWWPHLLANCCVAFLLNVVVALFVKHSSAVGFILAGMLKDAMIVTSGVLILSEVISRMQVFGFTLQLFFILIYSLVKTFPAQFEGGLAEGFFKLLVGDTAAKALESSPQQKARLADDQHLAPAAGAKDYGSLAEAGALDGRGSSAARGPQQERDS